MALKRNKKQEIILESDIMEDPYNNIFMAVFKGDVQAYEKLVETLINLVNLDVKSSFDIHSIKTDVLILDSSSSLKFSNHIIFQNIVFENNKSCLSYIKYLSKKEPVKQLTVFDSNKKGIDSN